jgi:UTP--glucose-1-phosphate uridylyltransferase
MKAVIPAAGLGTRNLPATKAIPKELLPIVDRPMIQFAVEEAVSVGIREVIIVTSPDKAALQAHFAAAPPLEAELERKGKDELLRAVRATAEMADVSFVTQEEQLGLGHAVSCARERIGNDPFAVLLPDELFGGGALLGALVDRYRRYDAPVIAVMEMPRHEISHYGVVNPEHIEPDLVRMKDFVEKPAPEDAPSNLGSVGRYLLTTDVLDALDEVGPGSGGEIQLTDGVAAVARARQAYAYVYRGERNDAGRPLGYAQATVDTAAQHPEIGQEFREYLAQAARRFLP